MSPVSLTTGAAETAALASYFTGEKDHPTPNRGIRVGSTKAAWGDTNPIDVGTLDVSTFILMTIDLALVALIASHIPALRATKADPMIALAHVN